MNRAEQSATEASLEKIKEETEVEHFKTQIRFCLLFLGSSSEVPGWGDLFMNGEASHWR